MVNSFVKFVVEFELRGTKQRGNEESVRQVLRFTYEIGFEDQPNMYRVCCKLAVKQIARLRVRGKGETSFRRK